MNHSQATKYLLANPLATVTYSAADGRVVECFISARRLMQPPTSGRSATSSGGTSPKNSARPSQVPVVNSQAWRHIVMRTSG